MSADIADATGGDTGSRTWLRDLIRPLHGSFREAFLLSLFVNILALAVPIFILQVYDRVVFHQGISTLYALLMGVLIALLFDFTLRQARSRLLQRVALKIDVTLERNLFRKLNALPLRTLESRPAGYWQSLFRDAEVVRNVFSGPSAVLVTDLPFALLFLGIIYVIAGPVVWVLLAALPCFLALALFSGRSLDQATKSERGAGQQRDSYLAEMLAGRTTIKALGLDRAFEPRWEDLHADTIERSIRRGGKTDSFANIGIVLSFFTTITLVSVGALAIINQELTIGSLIAATMLSNRVISPFNQLVGSWRNYMGFRQAVKRLDEIITSPGERQKSALKIERPKGELICENMSFGYDPDRPPVIDGLGLAIKPPGMLGIVGQNGSGKTTLLKLLQGLYSPSSGRVLLDGADISQFTRRELADWIGYVPQDCVLFSGTIRDNIAMTRPEASDDEVREAAILAGVHQYVIDLPDGYATSIGEAGSRLSGGQRQRIAIARALLPDPPVLLLDEVSGNLDTEAEIELRDTLARLARDHNILLVTHSPNLLRVCSNIMVLEKGKIALGGPANEVLPKIFGGAPKPAATEAPA